MKFFKALLFLLAVTFAFSACSKKEDKDENKPVDVVVSDPVVGSAAEVEHTKVTFEIENYGDIVVETYPEHAPQTVDYFLSVVENGFYNGFKIDKIVPGKYIMTSESSQDFSSDSAAAFDTTISGEFSENGRSNALKLEKYTLALNHIPGLNDTGMAQFMIMLSDNHDMDGKYAGFAKVVEGMEVVNKIIASDFDSDGKPVSPIVMKKVYINE